VEEFYEGEDGNLKAPIGNSLAKYINYYDDENRLTGCSFYNAQNNLVIYDVYGCAYYLVAYEGKDFSERTSCFGPDSNLVMSNSVGYAIQEVDRDDNGRIMEIRLFDADNALIERISR